MFVFLLGQMIYHQVKGRLELVERWQCLLLCTVTVYNKCKGAEVSGVSEKAVFNHPHKLSFFLL